MMTGDKRNDWALPDTDCWVAMEDGTWAKAKVLSFAAGGYIVMMMDPPGTRKVREHEIRPRDMYNFGKDAPNVPIGERRK